MATCPKKERLNGMDDRSGVALADYVARGAFI